MDFKLTPEQKMIQEMARDFTENKIKPVAARLDEEKQFPYENLKKMAGLGLMGMNIPVEYGGSEVGAVAGSLVVTEIAKGCASHAVTTSVTNMVAEVIYQFGQEEIKKKTYPQDMQRPISGRFLCHHGTPYRVRCCQPSDNSHPWKRKLCDEWNQIPHHAAEKLRGSLWFGLSQTAAPGRARG